MTMFVYRQIVNLKKYMKKQKYTGTKKRVNPAINQSGVIYTQIEIEMNARGRNK